MAKKLNFYWDLESEERKEYLALLFKRNFGIKYSDSIEEMKAKMKEALSEKDSLDLEEFGLSAYYESEADKKSMLQDMQEILTKEKRIERIEDFKTRNYEKIKGFEYSKAEKNTYGYLEGKKEKANVEKILVKGEIKFRLRSLKTGRFISLI